MSERDGRTEDRRDRHTARRNFLYGAGLLMVGAIVSPLGAKLFEGERPEPVIPGAPLEGFSEETSENGYTSRASLEVQNDTVNPIESHRPLNPSSALVVRPGDRLNLRYFCEMSPGVRIRTITVILPAGLKVVGSAWLEPHGASSENGEKLNDQIFGWVFDETAQVNRVWGGLTATVEAKYRTYLTAHWGGVAHPPKGKPMSGLARAVLQVEPT